jgi:hypothetical protein
MLSCASPRHHRRLADVIGGPMLQQESNESVEAFEARVQAVAAAK